MDCLKRDRLNNAIQVLWKSIQGLWKVYNSSMEGLWKVYRSYVSLSLGKYNTKDIRYRPNLLDNIPTHRIGSGIKVKTIPQIKPEYQLTFNIILSLSEHVFALLY